MNIKQAKEYIKNSVNLYLKKDEFGEYRVSVVRQRPIFLLGAPGIGKTAIMEQIAQEMGIALVSYSMTHHTRQSALGLPFITERIYGGEKVSVTEYTMSEIIASIYDTMESSGIKEGILFLDEINCVSETLAPSMLQFLQYKVFGRHRVPEGWVIVTAGNPPEYNKSVREFDVVTYDRLKVLEVEPDYRIWKEYAAEKGIHNAIVSYLDLKKDHFYCMEMTSKGRSYVTARGWEDLSEILQLYEDEQLAVDETLVGQYLRNERIVREFTAYYDLYNKYKKDYRIGEILDGRPSVRAIARAKEAPFDERLSLLGMLLDQVQADMKAVMEQGDFLTNLRNGLKGLESAADENSPERLLAAMEKQAQGHKRLLENLQNANSLSEAERKKRQSVIRFLEEKRRELITGEAEGGRAAYAYLKEGYGVLVARMRKETARVQEELHALFAFAEEAFAGGSEMLVLVTELTVNTESARFIAAFGSPDYSRHNEELMLGERSDDMKARIGELGLD
ncbi:MAG: AAA family ATPase [Roseburia sp.]|nr:AAA family ATPase [Roseburia sp.]MCM1097568.1 AAA family ATPase [Ruminococcus flavefaciens]